MHYCCYTPPIPHVILFFLPSLLMMLLVLHCLPHVILFFLPRDPSTDSFHIDDSTSVGVGKIKWTMRRRWRGSGGDGPVKAMRVYSRSSQARLQWQHGPRTGRDDIGVQHEWLWWCAARVAMEAASAVTMWQAHIRR